MNTKEKANEILAQLETDVLALAQALSDARNLPEGPVEDPLFTKPIVGIYRLKGLIG